MKTILNGAWNLLKSLLGSKKVVMTVVGVLVTYVILPFVNGRLGLGLDPAAVSNALYAFIAYVLGQGLADFGKERTKVTVTKPADWKGQGLP